MIGKLLEDHESVIVQMRKEIAVSSEKAKDADTIDFLTGLMGQQETKAGVLLRYLN